MKHTAINLVKLTFFTKSSCGLCTTAKENVAKALKTYSNGKHEYLEVDIAKPENKKWWDVYCFDVPVLHLEEEGKLEKLMHRFEAEKVLETIEKVEKA